ncbi:glycosyltransferase family 39 protein [Thioalbus denitrificans]|uniref:4-amino-4-deoxy-L-arabinose transferase-like glycosyltransferase n=1 Tax=Thioalbus denitrificans TaxID=547122 RepID=A0A369BZ97_9GAMM|nr:glycosyltransferase family 39 protein [Thioalbus denitrificans]RCX24954.1 4-amino-4-deoxy-L-arabinose transferase-like glycosyltransferase [Thioalbus denitrificans]
MSEGGTRVAAGSGAFVALLGGYFLLHLVLRLFLSDSFELDEAEQLLMTQQLAWGYASQPPLYTWLQWGFFALFGKGVLALSLLKQLLLFTAFAFCFLSARLAFGGRLLPAVLVTLSLLLLPEIAWESQKDRSHSVLMLALCNLSSYLVLRFRARRQTLDYLLLGLVLGLGLLSKYNFALFALALFLAALLAPAWRAAARDPRILLAIAIAVALFLPHGLWVQEHVQAATGDTLQALKVSGPGLEAFLRGLGSLTYETWLFLTPFWLVALLAFPGMFRWRTSTAVDPFAVEVRALLGRFFVVVFVLLVVMMLVFGFSQFKARWLEPFLFLVPLFLFLRGDWEACGERRRRVYLGVTLVFAVLVPALLAASVLGGSFRGKFTRLGHPLTAIAEQLRAAGYEGARVYADRRFVGGALLVHLDSPATQVPGAEFAPAGPDGRVVMVWQGPAEEPPADLVGIVARDTGVPGDRLPPPITLRAPYLHSDQEYEIRAVLLDKAMLAALREE